MKINILLVDDHELILDGLEELISLQKHYAIVGRALNGNFAKDIIAGNESIDIVLCDVSMPECNGIDLCLWIKQKRPEIKVLMLSMYDTDAIIYAALEAKADGFLLKNCNRHELFNAIERTLEGAKFFDNKIVSLVKEFQNMHLIAHNNILTPREIEIVKLIIQEKSSKEIAETLYISKRTVDNHRMHIMEKLNIHNTIGLVKYALSTGIII